MVGQSVMVPKIVGPPETAKPIHEKLIKAAPTDQGRSTQLIAASAFVRDAEPDFENDDVALVSYHPNEESDLTIAAEARRHGIDFILRGEILPERGIRSISEAGKRLAVSWRLTPVDLERQAEWEGAPMGKPVVVEFQSALERYPDLRLAADEGAVMQTALVRDTLPMFIPSVQRHSVELEIPYLGPGTRAIRQGNELAFAGRWGEAAAIWEEVHQRYRFSSVAVHNLAIAHVAKQEFSKARELSAKAVRMKPTKLHQQTLVWVERMQRAYHEAFDLPDPPEGWSVTH